MLRRNSRRSGVVAPNMATIDSAALEQVLTSIELRVGHIRRVELEPGALVPLSPGAVWLVFVAAGSVHGQPPLAAGCSFDVDRASHSVVFTPGSERSLLVEGDAFLTLGRRPIALETSHGATLMIGELHLSDAVTRMRSILPEHITVTDFAGLEPAAAALARNLQPVEERSCSLRSGDPVICRLMITTVLLSVIRAWAENGCAPPGWPSLSDDPFLDRVVEAIHEEPGREWTVETLAGVGAMSRTVFAERFRTALGRSPAHYVTEVRMDTAKRMLESGRPVTEVSRHLGYSSDEGFSRAFRRSTGMTPSAWRRLHRGSVSGGGSAPRQPRVRFDAPNSSAPMTSAPAPSA